MPLFEFQCPCGIKFEKIISVVSQDVPQACPDCLGLVERLPPEDVSGSFNQKADGMGPQNTGVEGFDAYTDQVIGDHARQGWESIRERQAAKAGVLSKHPDKATGDLSMTPDGDYEVLPENARGVHDRAIEINRLAMKERRQQQELSAEGQEPR